MVEIAKYWCEECKEVHQVAEKTPKMLYQTGFRYDPELDLRMSIGNCTQDLLEQYRIQYR